MEIVLSHAPQKLHLGLHDERLRRYNDVLFPEASNTRHHLRNEATSEALVRGRNTTRIDLANTNVRYEADKLRIFIDTSAFVYQLKFEDSEKFRKWMIAIKDHRAYDQFQSALISTGRPGGNQPISSTSSNLGGEGSTSFPTTPEGQNGLLRPNRLNLRPVQSATQSKALKQQHRLSNEQVEVMEQMVLRLESIYSNLQNAQSLLLESNMPESDTTEIENSSPTHSLFFSPLPYNPSDSVSSRPNRSRVNSISSTTTMCTATQATPTVVAEPHSNHVNGNSIRKPIAFISAAANFNDKAKRFMEEASAAHVPKFNFPDSSPVLQQMLPGRSLNERTNSDSDLEGSGVENSENSPSDDMPVLTDESDMNVPDMKGVVLKTPEHVAGRRTTLPAQQATPTTYRLLSLIKNNIGRELSKLRLPAILNEPLSVLQNLCEEMEYSNLLDLAAEMKDRTQRMLYVATFIITGFTSKAQRKAPTSFSPLLGETFECIRPEKQWRFLAEQVSLNPPTSAVHCESKLWVFDEEYSMKCKVLGKSLEINGSAECQIHFPKWRETYTWSTATVSQTNLLSPNVRLVDHNGDMVIHSSNGVISNIHFSKTNTKKPNVNRNVCGTITPPDGSAEPSRLVYGQWDKLLVARDENNEDRCIWRAYPMPMNAQLFYGFTQFAIELNEQPAQDAVSSGHLPITDSRQRPDIRLLELGRVEEAEAENKRMEDDQRRRQKNNNSKDLDGINVWKPLWFTRRPKAMRAGDGGSNYEFNSAYWRYHDLGGFKDLNLPVLW
ncbi:hypothetical protein ACTXT7_005000 [Hymenolepis weldensis]